MRDTWESIRWPRRPSQKMGGWGAVSMVAEAKGAWNEAQRTFVARLARVLEMSVERCGGATGDRPLSTVERQADLMAGPTWWKGLFE